MSFPVFAEIENDPYSGFGRGRMQPLASPTAIKPLSKRSENLLPLRTALIRDRLAKWVAAFSESGKEQEGEDRFDRLFQRTHSLAGGTTAADLLDYLRRDAAVAGVASIAIDPPYTSDDLYRKPLASDELFLLLSQRFNSFSRAYQRRVHASAHRLLMAALTSSLEDVDVQPAITFLGRVEAIVGGQAIVSMLNEKTGDRLEAECDVATLNNNGISEGDEFRCEVVQSDRGASVRFLRVPPKELPAEHVAAIMKEVDDLTL